MYPYNFIPGFLTDEKDSLDPYSEIAIFFDAFPLPYCRSKIAGILKTAYSERYWKITSTVDVLFFFQKLWQLIFAANKINGECRSEEPKIVERNSINPLLYRSSKTDGSDWGDFPRTLSFKEFADPYIALKRFFKLQPVNEWNKQLELLAEYTLSGSSITEAFDLKMDSHGQFRYLVKLVEATHLIYVREMN